MLKLAVSRASGLGFRVANADVTIITESPRLEPFKRAMRQALADAAGIPAELMSIKAKSNEGMGWIGRGEGIACVAVVSLVK
jgi:2-C-methyl-D-erythritol 2,4-cyclodiphosphate synthase